MSPITWPISVLPPQGIKFEINARSRSGGVSIVGLEQIVSSGARVWQATWTAALHRQPQILCWQAIAGLLDGRANTVLLPLFAGPRAPWPTLGNGKRLTSYGAIPFSDGTLFSDGSGFGQPVIDTAVAADAAQGAVSLTLDVIYAGDIQAGQHFSLGDRLYRIVNGYALQGSTSATLTITPPLREAVAAGTAPNFDMPVCRMRQMDDSGMDLDLDLNKSAGPTPSFIEDL